VRAAPVLIDQMSNDNQKVRLASIKHIKDAARPEHLDQLIDILIDTKNGQERKELEKTITAISMKIPAAQGRASRLLAKLDGLNDDQNRSSFYEMMGKIGDPKSLPPLKGALNSGSEKLKTSAVRALSDWPDAVPLSDLHTIAKNSKNETQRVLALRGYIRQ